MKLSKANVRTLVLWFFIDKGKFPPGTTMQNWQSRTMAEMQFDDPPLPAEPHYEKAKLALLLQAHFNDIGLTLTSPLALMKAKTKTMKDLWEFCYENMGERRGL